MSLSRLGAADFRFIYHALKSDKLCKPCCLKTQWKLETIRCSNTVRWLYN